MSAETAYNEFSDDIDRFIRLAESPVQFSSAEFRSRRLDFFRAILLHLSRLADDPSRDEAVFERIIATLLSSKRFFDIASLYASTRCRHATSISGRELFSALKNVLSRHVGELFTASLTYSSNELDELFCETLGDDRQQFLELFGRLFEERKLYSMTLSPNIQSMFFSIADENVKNFIIFSNIHFLAHYLFSMRTSPYVTPGHIDKWVQLILSPTTPRTVTDKIVQSMKLNPAPDILLLLVLLPRDDQRNNVLGLLCTLLEKRPFSLYEYRDLFAQFLGRAIRSDFYDFHQIPQDQKLWIANLILFAEDAPLLDYVLSSIDEENPHNDPKLTETKRIFAYLIGRVGEKSKEYRERLRTFLNKETLEESVRQEIIRTLRKPPTPPSTRP